MTPVAFRFASLLLVIAACSGSSDGSEPAPASHEAPAAEPEPEGSPDEAKLRAAQESSVEALCERLVDCAVQEATASMTPDEVAKLDVEGTAPRLRDECEADGAKSPLSPRQILVVQRCVNDAKACDELQTCLEEAKKKDPKDESTDAGG